MGYNRVNANQTKQERWTKYHLLKEIGYSSRTAHKLRDWTYNHLKIFLEVKPMGYD